MTVRKFLDLSTGHLTEKTRERMDEMPPMQCAYPHPDGFGWFVYVDTDPANYEPGEDCPYPPDLIACFKAARERDCDYILFDCDAEAVDYLDYYEDEEEPEPPRELPDADSYAEHRMDAADVAMIEHLDREGQ